MVLYDGQSGIYRLALFKAITLFMAICKYVIFRSSYSACQNKNINADRKWLPFYVFTSAFFSQIKIFPLGAILLGRCEHSNSTRVQNKTAAQDPWEEVVMVLN